MADGPQRDVGDVDEDVVGQAYGVVREGDVDLRARRHEGRGVEGQSFVPRLAVGVQQGGHGRAAAEGLDLARDLGRASVEGGFAAGDGHDSVRAQREVPDLEAQFAGETWEGMELRGGIHGVARWGGCEKKKCELRTRRAAERK